jgi:methyltransferase-like protein/2-polyprenyl-3-methyl-5-hydroxy-6-metoxy-1,4-benzoquinol methylase
MPDALAATYDAFPYESRAFADTHPDRLATVATLFGISPASLAQARILELGCGMGGNLVPIGVAYPHARLVGVDLSTRQISAARDFAAQVGVANVEFKAMSLTEIDASFGTFDYIIAHGIYSWIPDDVKRQLLRVCRDTLAPAGVAFVSYNTYPGWLSKRVIRDMMLFRARGTADPAQQVRLGREMVQWVLSSTTEPNQPYIRKLNDESQTLKKSDDSYLFHEYLEIDNDPLYYREFVDRVAGADLKVFADARYRIMSQAQPEVVRNALAAAGENLVEREQYLDFLKDRVFRRSLLCRNDLPATERANPDAVRGLRVATLVKPVNPQADAAGAARVEFANSDGNVRVNTDIPALNAMLLILADLHPRCVPFPELADMVQTRLTRNSSSNEEPVSIDRALLASKTLDCYGSAIVELYTDEDAFRVELSDSPRASPVAVALADAPSIPNLRHQLYAPSAFDRLVLKQLDGARDRGAIVERLIQAVEAGKFPLQQGGSPITDPHSIRDILSRSLEPSLKRLASAMLMIA